MVQLKWAWTHCTAVRSRIYRNLELRTISSTTTTTDAKYSRAITAAQRIFIRQARFNIHITARGHGIQSKLETHITILRKSWRTPTRQVSSMSKRDLNSAPSRIIRQIVSWSNGRASTGLLFGYIANLPTTVAITRSILLTDRHGAGKNCLPPTAWVPFAIFSPTLVWRRSQVVRSQKKVQHGQLLCG